MEVALDIFDKIGAENGVGKKNILMPTMPKLQPHKLPVLGKISPRIPSKDQLVDYLRKARGNKDIARKMALQDGWDISKQP